MIDYVREAIGNTRSTIKWAQLLGFHPHVRKKNKRLTKAWFGGFVMTVTVKWFHA